MSPFEISFLREARFPHLLLPYFFWSQWRRMAPAQKMVNNPAADPIARAASDHEVATRRTNGRRAQSRGIEQVLSAFAFLLRSHEGVADILTDVFLRGSLVVRLCRWGDRVFHGR